MQTARKQVRRLPGTEVARLQARIAELEATLKAIKSGEVDAIVVDAPEGSRIFTLQSPEEPYRLFAERMNEGAATLSMDGTILFCNQRLAEMAGVPAEKLVGTSIVSVMVEEDRKGLPELLGWAVKNDVRTEAHLLTKDRSMFPVQLSLSRIPVEENQPGLCLVATDLTSQKRVEQQLRDLNEHLEQAVQERTAQLTASNKELEAFAYSVSHDLRAPLRHLDGFLGLLRTNALERLDLTAQDNVERASAVSHRMAILIDELLQFSRMGRSELHKEPVSLSSLVEEVRRELEPEAAGRVVHWHVDKLPVITADKVMLEQALQNLLSNALKFTRPRAETEIFVRARKEPDGAVTISVQDNGVGFDMRYYGKLFQVFQRLHREDEFEGVGVGLANVRRIVERHGGRVWAESELGKGTIFYFTLPQEAGDAKEIKIKGEEHERQRARQPEPHLVGG